MSSQLHQTIQRTVSETEECCAGTVATVSCITVSLLVCCLTSQQHASVSQGRTSSNKFTCCHTEMEVADQTFHLSQSQSRLKIVGCLLNVLATCWCISGTDLLRQVYRAATLRWKLQIKRSTSPSHSHASRLLVACLMS